MLLTLKNLTQNAAHWCVSCHILLQWLELIKFSVRLEWIATYTKDYGPGCPELVQLLLEKGADPNAWAGLGPQKFTPLHIIGCWTGGELGPQQVNLQPLQECLY